MAQWRCVIERFELYSSINLERESLGDWASEDSLNLIALMTRLLGV